MTPRETELAALPALLSVEQAAQAARVSPTTVKRAIKAGQLLKDGTSKRHSKILKSSLLVFISLREAPAPAQHDVSIAAQYEDARADSFVPQWDETSEDDTFARDCAHYASLLPSIGQLQHPKGFSFEDYFK